jgi:hypothetical protein
MMPVDSIDERADDSTLELNDLEVALIAPHVAKMMDAAADAASRHRYEELATAIADRRLRPEHQGTVAALIELLINSGRLRSQNGPTAEAVARGLYRRTGPGKTAAASAAALSAALAKLKDQRIEDVSVSLRGPGSYAMSLATNDFQLVIRIDPSGCRIESLEVNLN